MSKKNRGTPAEELFDDCACANECTGIFQRIALDPEEVKKFHEMYNNIGKDSTER